MPMVTIPLLKPAEPGAPITSEGWNNVLGAIDALVKEVTHQRGALTVKVLGPGNLPFAGARVTAHPQGPPPRPALAGIFTAGQAPAYRFNEVPSGKYLVTVEADGVTSQQQVVEVTGSNVEVTVNLVLNVVPNVLGMRVADALKALTPPFSVTSLIDAHGVKLNPTSVSVDAGNLPVLSQSPAGGTLRAGGSPVFVHVAATSEVLKRVKVPDVRGMTFAEAQQALEAVGLKLELSKTLGTTESAVA
jgi:hypothetical protein